MDRLSKVSRCWHTRLDAEFRRTGLTLARARALMLLSCEEGRVTQKDLAENLGIETPTLVRLLDSLMHQGLIERHQVPEDRRANAVVLTAAAACHVAEANEVSIRVRDEILEGVPEEDLATAIQVLDYMASRLQGQADPVQPADARP